MNALLHTLRRNSGRTPWRERADELVRRYDDAFPSSRMCAHFVAAVYPEFQGEVTRQHFGSHMSASLRRYRKQ